MAKFRNYKQKTNRGKRQIYRKFNKLLYRPKLQSKVHAFSRVCYPTNVTFNTTLGATNGESMTNGADHMQLLTGNAGTSNTTYFANSHMFLISDLPQYSDLTALFEKYKLVGIQFKIIPFANTATTESVATNNLGAPSAIIHSVIDTTDNTALSAGTAGLSQIRQKCTYKSAQLINSKPFKRYFRPKCALEVYGTGATRYCSTARNPWISGNDVDVPHYGIKYIIEVHSPTSATDCYLQLKVECKYYVLCKDPY